MPTVCRCVRLPVLAVAILSGCGAMPFEAHRDRSLQMAVSGCTSLSCTSHNGAIEVRGVPGAESVAVEARLSARGLTQADADAHVELLSVTFEQRGAELAIVGIVPPEFADGWSATFSYRITAPPALAQKLESHNGAIVVEAMAGDTQALTHNGRIRARTGGRAVAVETHNGSIELALDGTGPVQGAVTTHNGSIALQLGGRTAVVDASTHNGGIEAAEAFAVRRRSDDAMVVEVGQGGGALEVATHNGRIVIR